MRILITGGKGRLAAALVAALSHDEVIALDHAHLDITNHDRVNAVVHDVRPDVVVNTAAFHQVDLCETEPERSFAVNAAAPQRLAAICKGVGALLVHMSTDYVFDGQKREPYTEEDRVDPLSVYGASKAAGEMALRCATDRHLIVRTTGLYGPGGTAGGRINFVERMLRLAAEGEPISVVHDQILTPSYTHDVAEVVAQLIYLDSSGTYHATNGGQCSWYEFAAEIFRLASQQPDLSPTTQAERPMPARRPAYSVLAHQGLRRLGVPEPRPWQDALREYMSS